MAILIDSNVILDIVLKDPQWFNWSSNTVKSFSQSDVLVINTVIYSEVSIGYETIEEVEQLFMPNYFVREPIPWEACFLAGKCFVKYRKRGGTKNSPLPDFFIGAHALVKGLHLMTRDEARYKTYFPTLKLICPRE